MTQEKIQRINELYRKSQAEGLSEAEKKEQDLLRKEYIANVKKNLRNQLNNIDMVMMTVRLRTSARNMETKKKFVAG